MQESCTDNLSANIQIVKHHIYEYKKGVRNLVLHTMKSTEEDLVVKLLKKKGVCFLINRVTENKINVFLGNPECVEIVRSFRSKPLNKLSPEQDFMLGIMLGYDRKNQFNRYLKKITNKPVPEQQAYLDLELQMV